MTAVHAMDVPNNGANVGGYTDFCGDIIRAHEKHGFEYWTRRAIWKEPLAVRLRTMSKGLAHKQICDDATLTTVASADYLLEFRKKGENEVPVSYPVGLHRYAGEREVLTMFFSGKDTKETRRKTASLISSGVNTPHHSGMIFESITYCHTKKAETQTMRGTFTRFSSMLLSA